MGAFEFQAELERILADFTVRFGPPGRAGPDYLVLGRKQVELLWALTVLRLGTDWTPPRSGLVFQSQTGHKIRIVSIPVEDFLDFGFDDPTSTVQWTILRSRVPRCDIDGLMAKIANVRKGAACEFDRRGQGA